MEKIIVSLTLSCLVSIGVAFAMGGNEEVMGPELFLRKLDQLLAQGPSDFKENIYAGHKPQIDRRCDSFEELEELHAIACTEEIGIGRDQLLTRIFLSAFPNPKIIKPVGKCLAVIIGEQVFKMPTYVIQIEYLPKPSSR